MAFGSTIADVPAVEGNGSIAVLDAKGVLVGALAPAARVLPGDTPVARAMVPAPSTIRPELRVEEVSKRLEEDGLDRVFVTTVSGVLLGEVVRGDLHV